MVTAEWNITMENTLEKKSKLKTNENVNSQLFM